MPIDDKKTSTYFSQRKQYEKGGIGRIYWDWRDKEIFGFIGKNHQDILDVGCGEGITLKKIILKYPDRRIQGVDILAENVEICRHSGLPVSQASVYDLKSGNESFDLCILAEVMEHLENINLALLNLKRLLRPGGNLIIVFPNDFNFKIIRMAFFKFKEAFADPGHVTQLTPKTIKNILARNGFAVKKIKKIPFFFWWSSLHCVVLAEKL